MKEITTPEVTRVTLQVLSIGFLIGASFWILEFFLPSILWAAIIVITTWPLLIAMQRRLWNRRPLAIIAMACALLIVVILPSAFAIGTIINKADNITDLANSLRQIDLKPPAFLAKVPVVGPSMVNAWQKAEALTAEGFSKTLAPYTRTVVAWFVAKAGSVGLLLVQSLLTLIIAMVLYAKGESAAQIVRAFCHRLAGARGDEVASLAAKAIRSVALGVIVTALVQAILSGIGLAVAGVHSAVLLTAIIFVLSLCQIGPGPVLLTAIVWLFWRGDVFSGSVLIAFTLVIFPLDNFLRPILIRKGVDMPLILVFIGVIGGLLSMGVIGLFIGPVILAVTNSLLMSWIRTNPPNKHVEF